MKKQMVSLVFILAAVFFLSLPSQVLANYAELPLVYGSAWEYGSDGSWDTRQLTTAELGLVSDGNSSTNIDTISSSIFRDPLTTSAQIYAPWVVVAFDASRLTDPKSGTLTLEASAYTVNRIYGNEGQYNPDAGNDASIYKLVADNWVGLDPNNPNSGSWGGFHGLYGPWDTAISQNSPTYTANRVGIAGRDISPEKLIWLKIGSGWNISGGLPYDSVATVQLTLNEISLSGDITPVPLPGSLLLLGSGLLGLAGWRRFRKS